MQIAMTLQDRITQAEKLPKSGELGTMGQVRRIRRALVGFTAGQMQQWTIVAVGDTFVTGNPTTRVMVTLDDDMIRAWAGLIDHWSRMGEVGIDESELYESVKEAADSLPDQPTEEE